MSYMCPVCGYPDLDEPAYTGNPAMPRASLEICQCCGFQFGYDDDACYITHEEWRQNWITQGMPWSSKGREKPENWNPRGQLRNIGIVIER